MAKITKNLLLIINPNAGKMKAESVLLKLVTEFSSYGYEVTVFPTTKKSDAEKKILSHGASYELIVCYGGDGTLSETVNGIARLSETDVTMPQFSFIPAGTANDFATTVDMPCEVGEAVKKIARGKCHSIDIGLFNNEYFIYVAAFGLFTSVSYTVDQEKKKMFGHLSYVVEGAMQVIEVPSYKMTVRYNDKVVKGDFVIGLVANTTSVAGMFRLSKTKVKLDDGRFELLLVKNPKNPLTLSQIMMDLSIQKYDPDHVIFERVSNVEFHCEESVPWCLDGENGGTHNKVTITNLNKKGTIRL